ncbi:YncE family protein [Pseudothauera nasutitermitis]|uniref:YncE family protein n=1 Tax=Pseudothauera nasutitermitis TaxID=2565930 RepID=A0A4S4B3V4_9RHOO|nr:YncE family protein [Pseudothauera nasutitermitis]THF67370.1 YncE family protein [Pseudothauera nasutitermitis]
MFKRRFYISALIFVFLALGGLAWWLLWSGEAAQPLSPDREQGALAAPDGTLSKVLSHGLYQAVHNPRDGLLYVASAEMAPDVRGGTIYQLDPQTLDVKGLIHTDEKNFGLALNAAGDALFVTNSLASAVTRVGLSDKGEVRRTRFTDKSRDSSSLGARTVRYDAVRNRIYVGGVGDPGVIWVLDAESMDLVATIGDAGKWVTGLLLDPEADRLYAANGDGEVLVIDLKEDRIAQRWKLAGEAEALPLNFALDHKRKRLYVTETQHEKTVFVLDASDGKVLQRLPVGDAMDVLYDPARDELYLTHREQGKVSILDGETHAVKAAYSLPTHPNSLSLGEGGQLYVTVKEPFRLYTTRQNLLAPQYYASTRERVVRIDLDKAAR